MLSTDSPSAVTRVPAKQTFVFILHFFLDVFARRAIEVLVSSSECFKFIYIALMMHVIAA